MKPIFSTVESWQQAEVLMQPVFIRLIDNIRKQLDQSEWSGTYQDILCWPEGISADVQEQVRHLQTQLAEATPDHVPRLQQRLDQLPQPVPGYALHLQQGDRHFAVDLWDLCYQICFQNYAVMKQDNQVAAAIDPCLIDESGDVDWNHLDEKVKCMVTDIFATLPSAHDPTPSSPNP